MDRELLDRNPMRGVSYSATKGDNAGLDPKAVRAEEIPNLDMVYPLGYWLARLAWPGRPDVGGTRIPDAASPQGRGLAPMLVAMTGLRNGEMFALRPHHFDLESLELRIETQLVEEDSGKRYEAQPKHGSLRTVTFAGFLLDDIAALIEYRRHVSGEREPVLFCVKPERSAQAGLGICR
jgi:integrase